METRDFESWFKEFSGWGLGRDDLIKCLFTPGDNSGDTIFISESGSEMTRYMGTKWLSFYDAAHTGWYAALNQNLASASEPRGK